MKKRYEALYVGGICDGYWDNKTKQYLDDDTIINLLNKEDYDSIWEERCCKLHKEKEELQQRYRQLNWRCNCGKKEEKRQKVGHKSLYRF